MSQSPVCVAMGNGIAVVPEADLMAAALAKATALGALPDPAYRLTKRSAQRATIQLIRDTLEEDMDKVESV